MGKYKYTDLVPTVAIPGFYPEGAEQLLKYSNKELRGLSPFGTQAGVITEDQLTDEIAEWLLARRSAPTESNPEGALLYERYIVLKDSEDAIGERRGKKN